MKVFELDSGPEALEQEVPVLQVGSPKTVTAGTDHLKEVVVFKRYQNMLSTSFCVCSNGSVCRDLQLCPRYPSRYVNSVRWSGSEKGMTSGNRDQPIMWRFYYYRPTYHLAHPFASSGAGIMSEIVLQLF